MLKGGKLWRQFVDYFCQQQAMIAAVVFVPFIFYLGNHANLIQSYLFDYQ